MAGIEEERDHESIAFALVVGIEYHVLSRSQLLLDLGPALRVRDDGALDVNEGPKDVHPHLVVVERGPEGLVGAPDGDGADDLGAHAAEEGLHDVGCESLRLIFRDAAERYFLLEAAETGGGMALDCQWGGGGGMKRCRLRCVVFQASRRWQRAEIEIDRQTDR